jgi:hypothetical protein
VSREGGRTGGREADLSLGLTPFKFLSILNYCETRPIEATRLGIRGTEDVNWMGIDFKEIKTYFDDMPVHAVYQSLKVMLRHGYIQKTTHKRRNYYRLTKGGKKALKEAVGSFDPFFWAAL